MIVKKNNKELLEVVAQNKFGICPMCNSPTMLLRSNYSAYHLSESGWITSQTDSKTEFKIVCPECGFVLEVQVTPYGLAPLRSELTEEEELRNPILTDNPIGTVIMED